LDRGTNRDFAQLFDSYLDAVYRAPLARGSMSGRQALIGGIVKELGSRGARRVLDCAAGTGFPALDLAFATPADFEIHCTDASSDMLEALLTRARRRGVAPARLTPPRSGVEQEQTELDRLVLDWNDLNQIEAEYDYVMCRGNSLAYASSWGINRPDVASIDLIRNDLERMADRVRPGGHLHVDAPWRLDLPSSNYAPVVSGAVSMKEEVTTGLDHRHWRLDVRLPTVQTLTFEKYSTLLTIHDVKAMLDDLGLSDTVPFQLAGERPGLGVIIARKPS
jgi:SAM-dependent methyltransferase